VKSKPKKEGLLWDGIVKPNKRPPLHNILLLTQEIPSIRTGIRATSGNCPDRFISNTKPNFRKFALNFYKRIRASRVPTPITILNN